MSAIFGLHSPPARQAKKKPGGGVDVQLKAMFDRVRNQARKVPADKRIRDVSALIEKGRRYGT